VSDGRLEGVRLLDAGCGSGLFSLAALRLGATVTAFDYDPDSVLTTRTLVDARASAEESGRLTLHHGSVLDGRFLQSLGVFDVVYSWGVLHHTGAMWEACRAVTTNVGRGGALVVALYHDAGRASTAWWYIKRVSAALPRPLQVVLAGVLLVPIEAYAALRALGERDPGGYVRRWTGYRSLRGMSRWHDHLDWVGGFPYEWAGPEAVIDFYRAEGFSHLMTVDAIAWGCNEFTFCRG
jgi:2-polyprenyl-6-hydroxyphenyl methylase/3-demethylubiquinone-9 3-methyltransferase